VKTIKEQRPELIVIAYEPNGRLDVVEQSKIIPIVDKFTAASQLGDRLHELDTAKSYVLHCKSGARSAKAIGQLRKAGFRKLLNLKGGILAWAKEVDPRLPTY